MPTSQAAPSSWELESPVPFHSEMLSRHGLWERPDWPRTTDVSGETPRRDGCTVRKSCKTWGYPNGHGQQNGQGNCLSSPACPNREP